MKMPRGAKPVQRHDLAASDPYGSEAAFVPSGTFPSQNYELAEAKSYKAIQDYPDPFLMDIGDVDLDFWKPGDLNNSFWIEESFAKFCAKPHIQLPKELVLETIDKCGTMNVSEFLQTEGFQLNGKKYLNGTFQSINWTEPNLLKSAIYQYGPIKIGVASNDFLSNSKGMVTPAVNGWAMYNYPSGLKADDWASICGYGQLNKLINQFATKGIAVNIPEGMPEGLCYAIFVYNSVGIIDEQSLVNMTNEAWVRTPVTIIK